ncbi:hypothetical protein [Bacillus velezensis]|uniref:hypothetical protein n=1 Tax=Bacillus velezensis TaxID=492670 RepID=UPI001070A049|nr:hypothetical protein [Bacillus velezensis]MCE4941512.1 hypothetical protein [Bacillus velezensis]
MKKRTLIKSLLVASSLTLALPMSFANAQENTNKVSYLTPTTSETLSTRSTTVIDKNGVSFTATYNKKTGDINLTSNNSKLSKADLEASKEFAQSMSQSTVSSNSTGSFSTMTLPEGAGSGGNSYTYDRTINGSTKIAQTYAGAVAAVLGAVTGGFVAIGSAVVSYFCGVAPTTAYYSKKLYYKKVKGVYHERRQTQWYKNSKRTKKIGGEYVSHFTYGTD